MSSHVGEYVPPDYELRQDAIYKLPHLSPGTFNSLRPPNSPFYAEQTAEVPKYLQNEAAREACEKRDYAHFHISPPLSSLYTHILNLKASLGQLSTPITNPAITHFSLYIFIVAEFRMC